MASIKQSIAVPSIATRPGCRCCPGCLREHGNGAPRGREPEDRRYHAWVDSEFDRTLRRRIGRAVDDEFVGFSYENGLHRRFLT